MERDSSGWRSRLVAFAVLAILAAAACSAQPVTAYDRLRRYAERAQRPQRSEAWAFASASLLGVGCAAGGVAWALAPHYQKWGPADSDQDERGYLSHGLLVGVCQALLQPALAAPWIADRPHRARDAFAAVEEEPDPAARERLAAAALERLARQARDRRTTALAAYVGLTGLSIGAYCLGENMIGRNPDAEQVGPSYVATVSAATALFAVVVMLRPTPAEATCSEYLRAQAPRD